jgi:hypothetical protein
MQPITLLGLGLCLGVLYLRYKSQPKDRPRRTSKQKFGTLKILVAGFLAWMALSYTLQHMIRNIDGVTEREPSLMERVVAYWSK